MIQNDKAQYSYDAFNRTTKVETFDGNIQLNRYDAEGLRYEMEENGNLVQFIFNQEQEVVTEEDSTGITRLIRDTELIARSTDTVRTYYHYASDEMGSTTHIVDEAGVVQNWYEYDAWGNITAKQEAIPNRYTYYGQQLDPITQQYYLRARFYNPVIARFTQEDTYRGDGLNLYAYCHNNPVFYIDSSGSTCCKGTKDPLQRVPTSFPNQRQPTALVPYEPEFATKQSTPYGNSCSNANTKPPNQGVSTFASVSNSQVNQPAKPMADNPSIDRFVSENLIDGSSMNSSDILDLAIKFLGEGYTEPQPGSGRFVSADGTRVFRMGENDILGRHGGGPHVNFEVLGPNPKKPGKMRVIKDIHIYIKD